MRPVHSFALALAALSLAFGACGGSEPEEAETAASVAAKPAPRGERRPTNEHGVPLTPGGDNSVQAYGAEASAPERRAVARTASVYLAARTAGRWAAACPHLTGRLKRELAQLVARSPQLRGKGCAAILAAIHPTIPASIRAQRGPIRMLSVRVDENAGFAIYRSRRGEHYYLPIAREGSEWKAASVNATALLG